ncbi:peroxidasin homolog isoform X3 [Strongylocentrotus purpuratus]|uniref:Uncharacterized protein n=1 Tax=Strongylocentrotus purpuratus TaxID=7668 RepID=A0A7M7T432_STRPU|nr:peroxidasin homolog isoform X3 [Strongylocentrotus purpuratus]
MGRSALLFCSLLVISCVAAQDLVSRIAEPDKDSVDADSGNTLSASELLAQFNSGDFDDEELAAFELIREHSGDLTSNLPPETCEGIKTAYHFKEEEACLEASNKQYRRLDGACNNLKNPNWGKAKWPLRRLRKPVYADGYEAMRVHKRHPDATLPNAREVSVKVGTIAEVEGNDPTGSMLLAILGQFLDHDVTHAPQYNRKCEECPAVDSKYSCCPISVFEKDVLYEGKMTCMDLPRTIGVDAHDCSGFEEVSITKELVESVVPVVPLPREHLNDITAYIDASGVYGSSDERLEKLRDAKSSSRLATHQLGDANLLPFLPLDEDHHECRGTQGGTVKCGLAGDERAAEQPTLTALHTIFVRLHNNIVSELQLINGHWDEERLFNETRKIVTGVWQHIVYNEYMPALFGPVATDHFKLSIKPGRKEVPDYNENLSATMSNVFASAAYRLGHSQIPSELEIRDNKHFSRTAVPLHHAFFNASAMHDAANNGMNGFVLGNIAQKVNKVDRHVTSAIQGHLFEEEEDGFGLDLLAMNIQRGREHGIPSYVEYREMCTPKRPKIESWDDLKGVFLDDGLLDELQELYGEDGVREIDAFIGFTNEKHMPGGRIGHTLGCLLGDQFKRLRLGDRFWYERNAPEGFTDSQLDAIKGTSLSRVLCDTLDGSENLSIQPYPLYTPTCDTKKFKNDIPWAQFSMENPYPEFKTLTLPNFSNHRVPCSDESEIPKLNLNPWKEGGEEPVPVDVEPVPVGVEPVPVLKETIALLDDGRTLA